MTNSDDAFDILAQVTAERLLWDIQTLMGHYGPEEGRCIAERTLTSVATMALDAAPEMQSLSHLERKAVAHAVKLALTTIKAEEKTPN